MKNTIRTNVPEVKAKLEYAIAGVVKYATPLGLAANLAGSMTQKLADIVLADGIYEQCLVDLKAAQTTLNSVKSTCHTEVTKARNIASPVLGAQFSPDWRPFGFEGTTAVPRDTEGLLDVTTAFGTHLGTHPEFCNTEMNINAARFNALHDDLLAAQSAVNARKSDRTEFQKTRIEKTMKGRLALRSLLELLKEKLDPLDGRWVEFGFNKPGAKEIPQAPENVTAVLIGNNAVSVKWNRAARAAYYRVYAKINGVNEELIAVGSPADLDFTIEGLPAATKVEIAISAVNNGGESQQSEIVTVTTQ